MFSRIITLSTQCYILFCGSIEWRVEITWISRGFPRKTMRSNKGKLYRRGIFWKTKELLLKLNSCLLNGVVCSFSQKPPVSWAWSTGFSITEFVVYHFNCKNPQSVNSLKILKWDKVRCFWILFAALIWHLASKWNVCGLHCWLAK